MSVVKEELLEELNEEHACLSEIEKIDIHSDRKEENGASTPVGEIDNEDVSDNEVSSQASQEAKSFTAMDGELDFEDEGEGGDDKVKNPKNDSSQKVTFQESESKSHQTHSGDEDGQCSENVLKESEVKKDGSIEEGEDDGEISDEDDLEEGEVKDNSPVPNTKLPLRQVCRYYNRGQCTYGNVCRFLHLSPNEKGNYNMFAPASAYSTRYSTYGAPGNGISSIGGPSSVCSLGIMSQRSGPRGGPDFLPVPPPLPPPPPEPTPVETAWERGLRQAKELVKKANKRKEEEPDFEEKRLNLSIDVNERNLIDYDKDSEFNKSYKRQNDVHPYKYDDGNDVFIDNGEREAREHWRGGRYENFEIKYTRPDIKDRRDRERSPRGRRMSSERESRHSKHRSEDRKRWRDDRLYEVQMRTPHRADEWIDPWRRSKTPKGGRRSRSRSGSYSSVSSYSYSDRSSRSSCSYSRSSSRSSCVSSRSRSVLPKRKMSPPPEPIMSPKKGSNRFPHIKKKPGIRSPKSSSRSRSVSKTPSVSRSRSYSRSLSMDSVSSASSSVTHSSSASGSGNRAAPEPVIANRAAHLAALKRQEEKTRAQKEREEREIIEVKGPPIVYDDIPRMREYEKAKEVGPMELRESTVNVSELPVSEQIALGVTPFPSLQHLVPNPDKIVKEPIKGLHKQQIKLTLLNKPTSSKLMSVPKKELDMSKIKPVDKDDALKTGAVLTGVKRPLSPTSAAKPAASVVPKKSASSRRDELLKQLKAVEDAIARKRAKFF